MNKRRAFFIVLLVCILSVFCAFTACHKKDDDVKDVAVTSVTIDKDVVNLQVGGTATTTLVATVLPDNATDKTVTWSSSNDAIATVSADGVVTAVAKGGAVITATAGGKSDTCTVIVHPAEANVSVQGVTLNVTAVTLTMGVKETCTLTPHITPANASNQNVSWSSSDGTVATVSGGKVTALKAGTATITVTTEDGNKTATCAITVKEASSGDVAVESVSLDKTSLALKMGETVTAKLTATVLPEGATDKVVTWKSSDETVATVDNEGNVTALKAGHVAITVTTADGGHTATCTVDVAEAESSDVAVTSVTVSGATEVTEGEKITLTATVKPDNATNKTVSWAVTNGTGTATINASTGELTGGTAGTVTVVATAGGVKSSAYTVTVKAAQTTPDPVAVESVTVSGATEVTVGKKITLTATVKPDNATDRTVSWAVTNGTGTATIDANGELTGGTAGTVTVVATAGGVSSTAYTVTVKAPDPVDYTADGEYVLDIAGGADKGLYTSTYDPATDSGYQNTHFKLGGGDALHVTMKLPKNKIIKITGKAIPYNTAKNSSLKLAKGTGTTGAVDSYGSELSVTGSTGVNINYTLNVTTEGVIVIDLTRGSVSGTGCNITELKVTISSPEPVKVTGVTISDANATLKVGETKTLTAEVTPDNADNTNINWSSSDETVATVVNGIVTAKKQGTATITATAAGDTTKTATCTVTVENIHVTGITLNKDSNKLAIGKSCTVVATVLPENATINTVKWTSSDEAVATVVNGVVTAKGVGKATITAASEEEGVDVKATFTIEVVENDIPVTGITLGGAQATETKYVGDTLNLTATVVPEGALDKSVTWSSSDETVATVTQNGVVEIVGEGTVTITVTSNNNSSAKATCTITASYQTFEVTFMDGATNAGTEVVRRGEKVVNKPDLTKEGYALVGWGVGSETGTSFNFNTPITEDITLYAKWQKSDIKITYQQGNLESAAIEWTDKNATSSQVFYKLETEPDSAYVEVDNELIRQIDDTTGRVDVLGLKGGTTYSFKVKSSSLGESVVTLPIKKHDRSGYAHFKYTDGVGAYKDDGTLKPNAKVLYVTDENKNTVSLTVNGVTVTGIGNILNSVGQDTGSGTTSNGGKPNTNQGIIKKLAEANIPLVVRFIGCVSDSGLYKKGTFAAPSTPLIDGLTIYKSTDHGGSVKDNGHMARMKSGKDITLEGVGEDAIIDGWGFHYMAESSSPDFGKSFEVRNLTFINTPEDAIGMEGVQISANVNSDLSASVERCWVHNNEFYSPDISSPAESDKSEGDGSCDFKRGQYFTCSYNYFEGCHKTNLVGSADTSLQYNLTYHHNYWKLCKARGPLARNANIHMYNNVFEGQTDYAMNTRANAYIYSEYNLFYMCKSPQRVDSGAIKSYNDSFSSCINLMDGTIVKDKSQIVSNSCKFAARNIDYSKFDTNAEQSYIPNGDYELQESVTEARKVIAALAGVTKRNAKAADDITLSELSYLPSSVKPTEVTTYPSDLAPGKISKTVYAFRLNHAATVTVSYSGDGVLVNEAGECLLTGNGSAVLNPGTYIIQPMNLEPGDSKALTNGTFKEITINSIHFEEYASEEFDAKLLADYNTKAGLIKLDEISYDNASYQLIVNAKNAYDILSPELQGKVAVPYTTVTDAFNKYINLGKAEVERLISEIGTVNENSGSKINAARAAYNALIKLSHDVTVSNYATLTAAEEAYENFKVTGLNNEIAALKAPETATTEEAINSLLEEYNNVKHTYDTLSEEQKAGVTNYKKVTDGITALNAALAPYKVKEAIAAIPEKVTIADNTAVKAARKAYDALTADQKAIVGDISKLTAAEAALEELASQTTVWNHTSGLENCDNSFFTVSGNSKDINVTEGGVNYKKAIKMESSTSITFTTATEMHFTIYADGTGTKIKVDDKSYTFTGGKVTVTLAAGDHTVKKDSTNVYVYLMELGPAA